MQVLPAGLPGGTGVDTALPGSSLCWQGSNSDIASDSFTGPLHLPTQNGHSRMGQSPAHQPVVQQLMVPEPPRAGPNSQAPGLDMQSLNAFGDNSAFNGYAPLQYERSDWARPAVRPQESRMTPQATVNPFNQQQKQQQQMLPMEFGQGRRSVIDMTADGKQNSLLSQQSSHDLWRLQHSQQYGSEQRDTRYNMPACSSLPLCATVSEMLDLPRSDKLGSSGLELGNASVPLPEVRTKQSSLGLSTSLSGLLGTALDSLDGGTQITGDPPEEDGRRAKRRLSNRDSARRTRQRKLEETRDLQTQVDQLKGDNIRLSQQVADLTKANEALVSSIPLIGEQNRETLIDNRRLREENARLMKQLPGSQSCVSCSSEQHTSGSPA